MNEARPDEDLLAEIEGLAVALAAAAGEDIRRALGGEMKVRYKTLTGDHAMFRDPVSDVDERVEDRIRAEVGRRFPGHAVVGEEGAPEGEGPFVWAIDPIDGTTNYVNGFPLFCASIGVLFHGRPVAGALWCSTSHALRAGVYHARAGALLRFEDEPLRPSAPSDVRRRLVGLPGAPNVETLLEWDVRKSGSASIECAFVAARLLEVAYFENPNVWDVAAGLSLIEASGGSIFAHGDEGWRSFAGFGATVDEIKNWRRPLAVGPEASAQRLIAALDVQEPRARSRGGSI